MKPMLKMVGTNKDYIVVKVKGLGGTMKTGQYVQYPSHGDFVTLMHSFVEG